MNIIEHPCAPRRRAFPFRAFSRRRAPAVENGGGVVAHRIDIEHERRLVIIVDRHEPRCTIYPHLPV